MGAILKSVRLLSIRKSDFQVAKNSRMYARTYVVVVSLILPFTLALFMNPLVLHANVIVRAPNNLGLIGYWSFDEGRGTQASDLSGGGNNGTLRNGPTWTVGRQKGALEFDGVSNSLVDITTIPVMPTFTLSAWIYNEGGGDFRHSIVKNYWEILGTEICYWSYSFTNTYWRCSADNSVPLDTWSLLTTTWDGSVIRHYVNGVLIWTDPNISSGTNGPFISIAGYPDRRFKGKIDELRIYNRALGATEIAALYSNSKTTLIGHTPTEKYSDGLVAHWTFDGKDTTAITVKDVAGSNDGAINGQTPTLGVIGQAMKFDGNSDISVPHSTDFDVTTFTIVTWIKTPDTIDCVSTCYRALFSKQGTNRDYNLYTHSNDGLRVTRLHFSSIPFGSSAYDLPLPYEPNTWHQVAITVSSTGLTRYYSDGAMFQERQGTVGNANNSYDVKIGSADNRWNGSIDDTRIYNRALTPDEIAGLYSATKPSTMTSSTNSLLTNGLVGLWSMDADSISGSTVRDMSGSGNDGAMVGNPTQVEGKIKQALKLNGSSSFVRIGDPANGSLNFNNGDFSLSMWVNIDSLPSTWKAIISKGASGSPGYEVEISNSNKYTCSIQATGGSNQHEQGVTPTLGVWQHLVCVYDRDSGITQYVDGEKVFNEGYSSGNAGSINTGFSFAIGTRDQSGGIWKLDGMVDDVRVYNRILTESEVEQLYSMGQ